MFAISIFAMLSLLCVYSPTVHAAGVTRAGKNTTETNRAALCYSTAPANINVTTFGAVWVNDTPTADLTNARWDENMTVAWNATTVSATMWTTAYNCPVSQGGTSFSSAKIFNLKAAAGGQVPISFPSGTTINRGTGTTNPGQFTDPPGALRVTLNVTGKGVAGSGPTCYSVAYSGQYSDSRGTGLTNTYFTSVCITRQAVPKATLDGVKIDDQGYDATTRPYGGFTAVPASAAVPFSTKNTAVSGTGNDARNAFYYNGAPGNAPAIPIGATGVSAHTVTIDTSALPTYKLVGYSICYTGQANCTSAGLAYGGSGGTHVMLPVGTTSFSYNFVAGRAYHMRWIFKLAVGVDCGSFSTTPTVFDSRTRFKAAATVEFSVPYTPSAPTMQLSIAPLVNFNGNPSSVTPVITTAGGASIATGSFGANASQLGPTLATGTYTATWAYDDAGLPQLVCNETFTVSNQPYLHVYGGDVSAGVSVVGTTTDASQSCITNDEARVYSWNNRDAGFTGAGAQYAVLALNQILDFSSASELPAGSGGTPTGLSFANTGLSTTSQLDPTQGLFGGSFGGTSGTCDFTSDIPTGPTNTTSDETIVHNIAAPLLAGTQEVHYVVGHDVYITGTGIAYGGTGGWASLDQIPYFKLVVVGGNIFIDKDVTQLDGIYVAEQADDGAGNMSGGTIYTCATGIRAQANPLNAGYYNLCKQKLTIHGAFAAQQIQFLRTPGTVGAAPGDTWRVNNAAEVFDYSPEVWLPRASTAKIGNNYDAITGLPPVL
ncbi:MAG: hypothetical protein ABIR37_00835 [Candidatus Saccharimonadales bacterium]